MAIFLSILFWTFIILSGLLVWNLFDSYSDGEEILFIFFLWILYGMFHFALPVETTYEDINNFKYEKTESGMHVIYGSYNEFTNDVYLIENIEDTTKVDVVMEKHFNSSDFNLNSDLKIKRKE